MPRSLEISSKLGNYHLHIGHGITHTMLATLPLQPGPVMIVTDDIVNPLYLPMILDSFSNTVVFTHVIPSGESVKTLNTWQTLIDAMVENRLPRDSTLISLGGGVISDLCGFAAACYLRGIDHIAIPTTLLAQVDASIGGKTGVNHAAGKNLIGCFYPPKAVIIDTQFLHTLPARQVSAGCAEIIKAALISDRAFFDWLIENNTAILQLKPAALTHAIDNACRIKANVVSQDEQEKGTRALLNLGHTFGHAIEQTLAYHSIHHGEAVAIGILLAAELSAQQGYLATSAVDSIKSLIAAYQLPTTLPAPLTVKQILPAMRHDKKRKHNQMRLILLKKIGEAFIASIDEQDINRMK